MKDYFNETRERWGDTSAYREHEQKTKNYTNEKWAEANDGLMAIFFEFAACNNSGASANSAEAQALVAKLQAHITANYYTCTDEILAGLGKMYIADERFKKNIDKYGEGTAEFASEGIRIYVEKKQTIFDHASHSRVAVWVRWMLEWRVCNLRADQRSRS